MSGNSHGLLRSSLFPSRCSSLRTEKQLSGSGECCGVSDDEDMATLQHMDSVFDEIESIMLQNNHKVATTSHSFSATSVSTYINDGQGAPKVYQAAVATRCAPGGIREIRKTSRDSVSGIEKIAVDRQLGARGRLEERSHNHLTGHREEQTEFINMDEEDSADFEEEWKRNLELFPPTSGATKEKSPSAAVFPDKQADIFPAFSKLSLGKNIIQSAIPTANEVKASNVNL